MLIGSGGIMENLNNLDFIKLLTKYYMDFLETDFHKDKQPKRSIDGPQDNFSTKKYINLDTFLKEKLTDLNDELEIKINTNNFKSNSDVINIERILELFKEHSDSLIESKDFFLINKDEDILLNSIESMYGIFLNDAKKKKLISEDDYSILINTTFIDDLLQVTKEFCSIESNSNDHYLDSVINNFNEHLGYLSNKDSLYTDLIKLKDLLSIQDKKELYLYFYTIEFQSVKYPIFYFPINLSSQNTSKTITLKTDNRVFINKKAIEYIAQVLSEITNQPVRLSSIQERILYADEDFTLVDQIEETLLSINDFLKLTIQDDGTYKTLGEIENEIVIKDEVFISVFDKSDEALINDYEEILELIGEEKSEVTQKFFDLINDFILKNPTNVRNEIDKEWDELNIEQKLLPNNPIPLNEEQQKIIKALRNKDCQYLTIQGPPGTGKSHTISALVFEQIINEKSTLILSDKIEALDVVEDKLNSTLNKARRVDNEFRNPILRLGKKQNTFSKILETTSISKLIVFHKASNDDMPAMSRRYQELLRISEDEIRSEKENYSKIEIDQVVQLQLLEETVKEFFFDINSFENKVALKQLDLMEIIANEFPNLKQIIEFSSSEVNYYEIVSLLSKELVSLDNSGELKDIAKLLNNLKLEVLENLTNPTMFNDFIDIELVDIDELEKSYLEYIDQSNSFLGFVGKRHREEGLKQTIIRLFPEHRSEDISKEIENIKNLIDYSNKVREFTKKYNLDKSLYINTLCQLVLTDNGSRDALDEIVTLSHHWNIISQAILELKFRLVDYDEDNLSSVYQELSSKVSKFGDFVDYARYAIVINDAFSKIPNSKYINYKTEMEHINSLKMANMLDSRVLDFFDKNRNTAQDLKKIISKNQKFPKENFDLLKEAFPCIIASIRDYSEYIPLATELFDLVIIDEASQVSIAQAFPAILRAKKVLILGDNKQFSNVKSGRAKKEINLSYKRSLNDSFRKTSYFNDTTKLKIENFNIQNSVLSFFNHISNFETMLMKHFRGYKELISYSNKFFYNDSLQVMKIRGKSIDEVLEIRTVKPYGSEKYRNSNLAEAEEIIKYLERHYDEMVAGSAPLTIGVLTPHTQQQKMIFDLIKKHPNGTDFFEKLHLKVMTFDTCQGEERDVIYYSMVATPHEDNLIGVFIKDFNSISDEIDGTIKSQRLNVGFSRAKERMVILVSKEIENFKGEIRNALQHYQQIASRSAEEFLPSSVDQNSPMEANVLNWFYQTKFWENREQNKAEFIPQFELGKYLEQMGNYKHPKYRVDFLLLSKDEDNQPVKIIMEYDGFKEHFTDLNYVDKTNYDHYYSEDDVYRQKVLESYGYKFIRLNRFNLTDKPIQEIDRRIQDIIAKNSTKLESSFPHIFKAVDLLKADKYHQCKLCKEFHSKTEIGSNGICFTCQEKEKAKKAQKIQTSTSTVVSKDNLCPNCGSKMVIRTSRYGDFYGCSRYPYCKGTRSIRKS